GLRISCNGVFCTEREGFFMDRDMQKIRLEGLRTGTNHLRLTGCYLQKMELEDIYIIGDFGVSTERVITRERKVLHFGDWCLQGYYHYPGSIVYHFSVPKPEFAGKRIVLRMGDYRGTLAKVCINGKPAGALIGKAYDRLEIGKYLTAQENTLDIEIVGSPRNMMGPFHQSYTGCSRISWADFRTEGRFHCDGYVLEPYGLMGQITVLEEEENDC
ncbi:MAG: hypothetical protein LUH07_02500, partial [Lachnospiraceae bacterium]|nr:hypothetical protein [Lachnospiraceae bacterium]